MARLLTPLLGALLFGVLATAQPRITSYEWWADGNFDARETVAGTTFDAQLDMSALGEGLHSISVRAVQQADNGMRYSPPVFRHFLVPGKANVSDNRLTRCEWWLDNDFEHRTTKTLSNANEVIDLNLDMSALGEGLHCLTWRVLDANGGVSGAIMRHFFIPSKANVSDNRLKQCEWWLDNDFEHRTTKKLSNANEVIDLDLDMSALGEGLHSIALRVLDANGGVSGAIMRHFLIPSKATVTDNSLTQYEWWLDNDFEHRTRTAWPTDGVVDINLDMKQIASGVHSLSYRVVDAVMAGPTQMTHFIVPDVTDRLDSELNIAAYGYWFNSMPLVMVEVTPSPSIVLDDVIIPLTGIVPNVIKRDTYRFDAPNERVIVTDDVLFGVQVFNDAGVGSAAFSEVFPDLELSVNPQMRAIADGDKLTFATPAAGEIRGFRYDGYQGDNLQYTITGPAVQFDLFDDQGNSVAMTTTVEDDRVIYLAEATSRKTYAMVYDASGELAENTIALHVFINGDVNNDKLVDVADLSAVINAVLGRDDPSIVNSVDINHDGMVDVTDVALEISLILGSPRNARRR